MGSARSRSRRPPGPADRGSSRSLRRRRCADADQRHAESRHPGHHGGGHADRHQLRRRRHDGGRRRWRRDGHQRRRGQQHVADRQLCARSGRGSRSPLGDGHDGRRDQRRANLHDQSAAAAGHSDADERLAESRNPGHDGRGHADGHQFRRRRHDGERRVPA